MSINNEEEFKVNISGKQYLINISILEDQLSLVLTILKQPPIQYSGFFSLNELRISSKIFHHTNSLFEAKEIIKRTVIKKQLFINEDDHRVRITFDTGLGEDSLPFPIILFRDLNVTHLTKSQVLENKKQNEKKEETKPVETNQNNKLRASIGNNINNKMLNQITPKTINDQENVEQNNNTQSNNLQRVTFNNFRKEETNTPNRLNNTENRYKDFINMNNNILYDVYNNMNNNKDINSSFYKNLKHSFNALSTKTNISNKNKNNNILTPINPNYNINNINNANNIQNQNNINNNIYKQPILSQSIYMNNNITPQNMIDINKPIPIENNTFPTPINIQYIKNIKNAGILQNKSFRTAPLERNLTKIPNSDKSPDIDILNKSTPIDNPKRKINLKRISFQTSNIIEELDDDIDEEISDTQGYRFKNVTITKPKKVKGNLEKFKEFQNIGDYVPSGIKFVSYLKFPATKSGHCHTESSTLSCSVTSSSNRICGIEQNIIKNPSELDEITTKIQRILNKKNIKYKIIYRATMDGDSSKKFHEKCDNIKNTFILIYASGNKRFGGFTTQIWNGDNVLKKDNNCFIFSIDTGRIYDVIKDKNAIHCNADYGPIFIDQIKLLDKFFTQGGITSTKGKTFNTKENYELTGGAEKFGIKEVEVYYIK